MLTPRQCELCGPCQKAMLSYIMNETSAEARIDYRALGQSPEAYCIGLCPGMEVLVPAGACLFNHSINKSHNDPRHNSGEDVKQELLHKATSFTEDCPCDFIAHEFAQFNSVIRGLFCVQKAIKLKDPCANRGQTR